MGGSGFVDFVYFEIMEDNSWAFVHGAYPLTTEQNYEFKDVIRVKEVDTSTDYTGFMSELLGIKSYSSVASRLGLSEWTRIIGSQKNPNYLIRHWRDFDPNRAQNPSYTYEVFHVNGVSGVTTKIFSTTCKYDYDSTFDDYFSEDGSRVIYPANRCDSPYRYDQINLIVDMNTGDVSELASEMQGENVPFISRFSPDNNQIVFSTNNKEIYFADAQGKVNQQQKALKGEYPFWISDNQIVYVENGNAINSFNLDTQEITQLYKDKANIVYKSPQVIPETGEILAYYFTMPIPPQERLYGVVKIDPASGFKETLMEGKDFAFSGAPNIIWSPDRKWFIVERMPFYSSGWLEGYAVCSLIASKCNPIVAPTQGCNVKRTKNSHTCPDSEKFVDQSSINTISFR